MNTNINKTVKDIESIKIQGATNIAKASIGALFDFSKSFQERDGNRTKFLKELEKNAKKLSWARPDEPLNQSIINFIVKEIKNNKAVDIKKLIANFQNSCNKSLSLIYKNEKLIIKNGVELIKKTQEKKSTKEPVIIFTFCNSSTVNNILIGAYNNKIPIKVYNSETRPKFQGRILAKSLADAGIDVTMTVDSAAPFLISKIDPDNTDIDMVIIGTDVIAADGSALNKIGSYSLSLSAKSEKVPLYVAGTLLKLRKEATSYKKIEIEKRDPSEVWNEAPKCLKIINYAFDIVPSKYISKFITEFGIIEPKNIKRIATEKYKTFL